MNKTKKRDMSKIDRVTIRKSRITEEELKTMLTEKEMITADFLTELANEHEDIITDISLTLYSIALGIITQAATIIMVSTILYEYTEEEQEKLKKEMMHSALEEIERQYVQTFIKEQKIPNTIPVCMYVDGPFIGVVFKLKDAPTPFFIGTCLDSLLEHSNDILRGIRGPGDINNIQATTGILTENTDEHH